MTAKHTYSMQSCLLASTAITLPLGKLHQLVFRPCIQFISNLWIAVTFSELAHFSKNPALEKF